jgi:hypothetical protein
MSWSYEHTFDYVYDLVNQVLAAQAVTKDVPWTTAGTRQAATAAALVMADHVDEKGD